MTGYFQNSIAGGPRGERASDMSKKTAGTKGKHFPVMENMTVSEVRDYLEGRQSIILPMGVIEQHGYHLPLSTDALVAREIGRLVGERAGILTAPTMHLSFSGGQLPGTINVSPNVMGLVVADILRSLAVQGFRNVFLLLAHAGSENMRALDNALRLLLRDDPGFKEVMLVFAPIWKFCGGYSDGFAEGDWHAGWAETSMVMALAPELVQMDKLEMDDPELVREMRKHPDSYQCASKPVDHECVVPRMSQKPGMRVGVMGDPGKASPELGARMVEDAVSELSKLFTQLEKKRSAEYREVDWTPEPILLK